MRVLSFIVSILLTLLVLQLLARLRIGRLLANGERKEATITEDGIAPMAGDVYTRVITYAFDDGTGGQQTRTIGVGKTKNFDALNELEKGDRFTVIYPQGEPAKSSPLSVVEFSVPTYKILLVIFILGAFKIYLHEKYSVY